MPMSRTLVIGTAGGALEPGTVTRREPGPDDVLIDISHVGICHSDIHQGQDDWGGGIFPMVPGHEIVGTVAAVGSAVRDVAVGDRVGVGCLVDACGECENCARDEEPFCLKGNVHTYNAVGYDGEPTYGGYSNSIVVRESFVLKIPDSLPSETVAPLLCCGITTYSALRRWRVGPGKRVAIIGLGGLGHIAVKLAHSFGAEVTVLSRSLSKEEDGIRLGADRFLATGAPGTVAGLANTFDVILNTVSADISLETYLPLLRLDGALVTLGVGIPPTPLLAPLLLRGRGTVTGSLFGGLRETQEMLDYCGARGIGAEVEVIKAADVNEAWRRVVTGDVRYRFVLDVSTL
jgi:alcohol dehydrogenase (NADP+)